MQLGCSRVPRNVGQSRRRAHHATAGLVAALVLVLVLPVVAAAQAQGSIQGAVTDTSNAALPGVTVTATESSSGRQYVAVTDARGEYRMPSMLPGTYRLEAVLPGFATVVMPTVELLVGQNATLPFVLGVAGVKETVTVNGDTPLVDTASARVAGNVDRRQMEALPLQGRNWVELALMVKGVTANDVSSNRPGATRDEDFQLNLDGQQVTYRYGGSQFGQPKFSREAIAEFRVSTTLFDITEGRSTGLQVQAISRSGTNDLRGSVYGFFRDDKLQAADFVAHKVLPFQDQQLGGALGGPIRKDRLLYFGSYEFERQPQTVFVTPTGLNQSFSFSNTNTQNSVLGRVDQQLTPQDHLSYRGSYWRGVVPFNIVSTQFPSQAYGRTQVSGNVLASWARVLDNANVQEIKVGFSRFHHPTTLVFESLLNTPNYVFGNITIGTPGNFPQDPWENNYSARYDLTSHHGSHDLKIGAELLWVQGGGEWSIGRGQFQFTNSLSPAEIQRRFPEYDNPSTWDLSGLDPNASLFQQFVGNFSQGGISDPNLGLWAADTWRTTSRMTLNYGVRWDDAMGLFNPPDVTNTTAFKPFGGPLFRTGMSDHNNVAPRVGFTYAVTDSRDLVIRGGTGKYFSAPTENLSLFGMAFGNRVKSNVFLNDGRPGFIQNPTRNFTAQQIAAGNAPQAPSPIAWDIQTPWTWQSAIGFQKQIGRSTGVEADLTHAVTRHLGRGQDINLTFDPVTGYNVDPITRGRPDPAWGQVTWLDSTGKAEALLLSTAVTRRMANHFQASVNYTLTLSKKDNTTVFNYVADNQFDRDADWGPSSDYQRHTLRGSAIADLPKGFSLAGTYRYGSGAAFATTIAGTPYHKPGINRLNLGSPIPIPADVVDRMGGITVIPTGATVPRNALMGLPLHKVDVRLTKDIALGGQRRLSGIFEVFNVFNHANYGAYNGQVGSATFGRPVQSLDTTYTPRAAQLAFRLQF